MGIRHIHQRSVKYARARRSIVNADIYFLVLQITRPRYIRS